MGLSVRRVSVLITALALLMSSAVAVRTASRADAVTCVSSRSESFQVSAGIGFGYLTWPGGTAKVRVTYRTASNTKMIRVRIRQGTSSTFTTLQGNSGREVTKTVNLGYHPRSTKTMLWFEPRGDSAITGRIVYSYCLYKA
ncbi:hypothetical protein [Kribbella sp. NPDC048928]|uniref:hypothetical protein n=1 Tax=Kribbella sp. NPDC048928 TaxID=3364111 RepID=UPI00371B3C68